MGEELLQVTDPSLSYIILGGFVVIFSMVSLLVKEKLYINEVVLGTAFGIIIGPYCANAFDPRSWGDHTNAITLEVMRVVLAIGLFAIGVELPQSYMADHAKSLLVMVVPTMAFGWIVVATVIYLLFPSYNYISALVIAACLTPTDPIISAAIVGGKFALTHVPPNLRRILSAESAANDGLAYPFLSISIYLTLESSRGTAIGKWFLIGWLYEVILGTVLGAVLGILFCRLMKISYRKGFIDRESYVAQYLSLALFTIGIVSTLGSDDLLAAFAAGTAISWDGHFNDLTENEVFSSVIDLLLNCACFVYIGAWLPFDQYNRPDLGITPWRLVVLFIVILLIRRIPPLLLLFKWVPEIVNWREALFSGHFGPMGVGAVFVSTLAATRLPTPHNPPENQAELLAASIQTVVSFVVLGSIIVHGLSIPFFSFGKNMRTRTLSVTHTWTPRHSAIPDWLLGARRALVENPRSVFTSKDPEQGHEMRVREAETLPDGHTVSHVASVQSERVEPTPDGHGISSAFARPDMARQGSGVTARTSQVDTHVYQCRQRHTC
ncbi:Sodium/hydrogen exchanger family-domain-containing protein [Fomitopsis serialis]|uniref:Sodium/hydrogen exchanger family-domain-containing protein n=1 Tax=Fomitopsis serialis TaxID=139415 RepID=UPI00200889A8|nr:Sodium/hydrogen exchanger family-domain-containing protein [Neoantrodia serialis]KAH9935576.1 Sodium/hydrogen exchanger family-domain-containing protein [Neoantrodia serialis]